VSTPRQVTDAAEGLGFEAIEVLRTYHRRTHRLYADLAGPAKEAAHRHFLRQVAPGGLRSKSKEPLVAASLDEQFDRALEGRPAIGVAASVAWRARFWVRIAPYTSDPGEVADADWRRHVRGIRAAVTDELVEGLKVSRGVD
jgi:hypothetical protein